MASRYRKEDAVTLAPRGWDSHPHEHTVIRIWFYPVLPSVPEHFYSFRKNESHVIIAIVAIVIFGPKKIPELGNALGKTLRGFKEELNSQDDDTQGDS